MNTEQIDRYSWNSFWAFWGIVFLAFTFSLMAENDIPIRDTFLSVSLMSGVLCGLTFLHIKYLIPLYKQKQWLPYLFFSLILLAFSLIVEHYVVHWFYSEYTEEFSTWQLGLSNLPMNIFLMGVSSLLHVLTQEWMISVEEKANLKNEKLTAELNLLKAQINPHFLFNTLNNIYFYAYTQHPDTPEMIEKLSNILRYISYKGSTERSLLKEEIESMDNLFGLYQMKNDEQKSITFEKSNCNGGLQIAPLILLNLLENVFKHSDALTNEKGFIKVKAKVDEEDVLYFEISNSIKKSSTNKNQFGIGQNNIHKQLALVYPNNYQLETEIVDSVFKLNLNIQLDG